MVKAWAYDVADGRDALLVAYHRDAVESLNRAARAVWGKLDRLIGPELEAPGGRRYRAGDRVITLCAWARRGMGHFAARRRRRRRPGAQVAGSRDAGRGRAAHGARVPRDRQARPRLRHHRPPVAGLAPWTSPTPWRTAADESWPMWR